MKRIVITMMMVANVTHAATNGVSVVCNVPEPLVVFYELKMPIIITVSNGTENVIPFIRDKSFACEAQIWIDLGNKDQHVHPPNFGLTRQKDRTTPFTKRLKIEVCHAAYSVEGEW